MQIVLRKFDLGMVEPDVRIIRKRQANAVIQGKHQLSIRDVILLSLRHRERRRRLLVPAHTKQPLHS